MSVPLVGIVMGSRSDWETLSAAAETLERLRAVIGDKVQHGRSQP